MTVTNRRLLEGLEKTLSAAAHKNTDPALAEMLSSSKIILDELFSRDDDKAAREHYKAGRAILAQAATGTNSARQADINADLEQLPLELHGDIGWPGYNKALTAVLAIAEKICRSGSAATKDVDALLAWEADGYRFATRQPLAEDESQSMVFQPDAVIEFIRGQGSGYEKAEMQWFNPLPGGFSKQTVILQITTPAFGNEELVLRGEGPIKVLDLKGQDISREYHLLRYLHGRGIRMAEPLWLQQDKHPHYLISRRVPGSLRGGGLDKLPSMSDQLIESLATELAKVHALPLDFGDQDLSRSHIGGTPPKTRAEATSRALHEWTDYWHERIGRVSPALNRAIDWIYANVPGGDAPPALVHADCGANNLLVHDDRISAILDWEISHLGDPAADVSWVLFGMSDAGERDRFLKQYQRISGLEIDPFSIKFYEVVAGMKLVIALFEAQEKYQTSPDLEVKLCKLGLPLLHHPLLKLSSAIREAESIKK